MKVSHEAGADSPGAFLTVAQLARRWLISEHRLYQMRKSGEGPLFTIVGRIGVRYPLDAVLEYEAERSFKSTAEFLASDRKRAHVVAAEQKVAVERRPAALHARLAKAKSRKRAEAAAI
jgi:hypothetical protein